MADDDSATNKKSETHPTSTPTDNTSNPAPKAPESNDNRPPPNPPPCTGTVECNMMEYADDKGVKHRIYLPKGTMQRASQLFLEENWDELGKFPAYEGQGYKDDDLVQVTVQDD